MKKTIYYLSPFIISPFLVGALSLLDGKLTGVVKICFWVILCLYAALMGSFSSTERKFDYLMTAVMPLSLAFALFIVLLLDNGFSFSLSHALNFEYYFAWLPMFLLTAFVTFAASFQPIRIKYKRM